MFASLKGLSVTGTISSRGVHKKVEMNAPPAAQALLSQATGQMKGTPPDAMKQILSAISVPLPEEPLGAGAKWEVKRPWKLEGMTIDQTGTASLEGERVTAQATIAANAANPKFPIPPMPGMKLDISKFSAKATGKMIFDLDHVLPPEANLDVHVEASMAMTMGTQKQPMGLKIDMSFHVEAK
jgi:hypothetical protein